MQSPGQYRFFLIPPKVPTKNQATPKNTCQILLPKKIPGIENFKPKKILRSSSSLEIPGTPPGLKTQWTSVKCCNLCGNYKLRWWKDAMYSRIIQCGLLVWADLGWRIPMGHSSKLTISLQVLGAKIVAVQWIKSRIWDTIDDWYIKNIAKNQVFAVFHSRVLCRNVSPKFIELCLRRHVYVLLRGTNMAAVK